MPFLADLAAFRGQRTTFRTAPLVGVGSELTFRGRPLSCRAPALAFRARWTRSHREGHRLSTEPHRLTAGGRAASAESTPKTAESNR
jgi:hypothetical protein